MATKFIQPPIPASHVSHPKPITTKMRNLHSNRYCIRFGESPFGFWSNSCLRAADKSSELAAADGFLTDFRTISQIKEHLLSELQGINRGIFGVPSEKKNEIERLVELLESQNPTPEPTLCLEKAAGTWKLVYSTITILGSKRTKLGLRDFITLGDFLQFIDVAEGKAVNVIKFSAKGLNLLRGQLTVDASFKVASKSLMNVFRKNYDMLLGIFNPEGWLEITYVDDSLRIGRDDKENIFILERIEDDID